jgi:N-hydroxyarylamine O-acetyltransferase
MWKAQYRFTLQPYDYPDYEEMCRYHQTSPDSPFTRGQVCTLATSKGRVTLRNGRLITTVGTRKEERQLSDEERGTLLREMFGVDLTVSA